MSNDDLLASRHYETFGSALIKVMGCHYRTMPCTSDIRVTRVEVYWGPVPPNHENCVNKRLLAFHLSHSSFLSRWNGRFEDEQGGVVLLTTPIGQIHRPPVRTVWTQRRMRNWLSAAWLPVFWR
jgi:hypothetical protein